MFDSVQEVLSFLIVVSLEKKKRKKSDLKCFEESRAESRLV